LANASKVLILTLPPDILGDVATKAKIMADFLRDAGCDVTIALGAVLAKRDAWARIAGCMREEAGSVVGSVIV